jgi:hypothetical protein
MILLIKKNCLLIIEAISFVFGTFDLLFDIDVREFGCLILG